MSHVDDGTLHAYLDGELSPVERGRLESHLADCAPCRERLAQERSLIESAERLLALAAPPATGRDLRGVPRRRLRFLVPGVWAASLAAAFLIGRTLFVSDRQFAPPRAPAEALAPVPSAAAPAVSAAPAAGKRAASPPRTVALAEGSHRVAATESVPPAPAPVPAAAPAPAPLATPGVVSNQAAQAKLRGDSPAFIPPTAVTVTTPPLLPPRADEQIGTSWPVITAAPARDALGAELVQIPGLPIRDIRQDPANSGTVLVEQELAAGTVVQLLQARAEASVGETLMRAPRTSPLVKNVGRLRVQIAGPLSVDSLFKLLEAAR
ncbi:MAG TPA: zf-HC2 domain-containing protein [Gemmatimonadales bacterium]|nr:zf-HC2 domain-containing protein [Gemmatimonadales bacterium]